MDEKLKKYEERHIRWQNIALTQMGYVNNLLLAICMGFLTFAFDKEFLSKFSIYNGESNEKMTCYAITLLLLFLSILSGLVAAISRLYDFRITRHIIYVRKKYYEEKDENSSKELSYDELQKSNYCKRICSFWKIIFYKIDFMTKDEIKSLEKDDDKFKKLRQLAKNLGEFSWRKLKMQAILLLFSAIFYIINLFI